MVCAAVGSTEPERRLTAVVANGGVGLPPPLVSNPATIVAKMGPMNFTRSSWVKLAGRSVGSRFSHQISR